MIIGTSFSWVIKRFLYRFQDFYIVNRRYLIIMYNSLLRNIDIYKIFFNIIYTTFYMSYE